MNSPLLRSTLITVGVIVALVGAVFAGQGMGLIPGSFMTGDSKWLVIGIIMAIVGIVLLILGLRRPKSGPSRG